MIVFDSHVHTSFSTDSETKMEDMIKTGIHKRLQAITFTDHMDYHFPPQYNTWKTPAGMAPFTFDTQVYFETIHKLKKQYESQIQVGCGVEVGLKEDAREENYSLCQRPELDYVIGSIHIIENMDPYYPEYWESFDEKKGLRKYFETMLANLQQLGDIHINTLGHLDYIVRYAPSGQKLYSYQAFSDLIDAILEIIIERQIALEVNTSGFKNGSPMPNPGADIIRRYHDLGGEYIVFGSDAHTTDRLAKDFDRAEQIVQAADFKYYTTFQRRKPILHAF